MQSQHRDDQRLNVRDQQTRRETHDHAETAGHRRRQARRRRLARSEAALSVLDAMEEEHERIDPLLAAVDAALAQHDAADGAVQDDRPGEDRLADVIDVLVSTLTGHLGHEERDGLPLIGVALTSSEWRGVGFKIARKNGLSGGGEMFAWILDGADREDAAATLGQLPPPLRLLYRAVWKPASPRPRAGNARRRCGPARPARWSIGPVLSGSMEHRAGYYSARGG